jgi:hypothetical protein
MRKPEAAARRAIRPAAIATALVAAGAFLTALALSPLARSQAAPPAVPPSPPAASAPAQARAPIGHASAPASKGGRGVAAARPTTSPVWRELSPSQQQALAPLSAHWNTLSEPQKRKWIALSANFPKMSGEEQAKLHSRMTEWAALSPQQRTIARLNYGAAQTLSPNDKKAKWEAYQALSPEEKKKLAAKAAKPQGTAAALRPVPAEKLATVPRQHHQPASKTPRIAAAPNQVDNRTLLPQQNLPQQTPPPQTLPQQPPPQQAVPQQSPPQQPLPPQAGTPD